MILGTVLIVNVRCNFCKNVHRSYVDASPSVGVFEMYGPDFWIEKLANEGWQVDEDGNARCSVHTK